jgi:hypothetical protein
MGMSSPIPPSPAPNGPNPKGGTLVKTAWSALRSDKELLGLPIVGGLASMVALLPALVIFLVMNGGSDNGNDPTALLVVVAVVSAFLVAVVSTFFAVALAAGAHERMNGGNPTLQSAMGTAWKHKKGVIGWALLSTTVGLIMQALKDNVKGAGPIMAAIGNFAWAVASFFAIPIIAANNVGPIEALKLSTSTMKQRWSSAARVQLRLGLYGLGLALGVVVGVVLVAMLAKVSTVLAVLVGVLIAIALLLAMLVLNAITSYARVALYRYAAGMPTPGFASGMLQAAVIQK